MAKKLSEMSTNVGFRDAARIVLMTNLRRMMNNAADTRAGVKKKVPNPEQVEALHDMRVGSRRLRAALSVFAKIFPKSEFRDFEVEVADITTALGGVRDQDVLLENLRAYQATLPENEAYGVGLLIEQETRRRNKARKKLRKALAELEKERFERRFQRALERATEGSGAAAVAKEKKAAERAAALNKALEGDEEDGLLGPASNTTATGEE